MHTVLYMYCTVYIIYIQKVDKITTKVLAQYQGGADSSPVDDKFTYM